MVQSAKVLDLHNHVVFGLDDGCRNLAESKALAEKARAAGHQGFVATPHIRPGMFDNTPDIIRRRADETRATVIEAGLEMHLGCEYYFDYGLREAARQKSLLTLAGSRYILCEFPQRQLPLRFQDVLFELQLSGYVPVIAHPERCEGVSRDLDAALEAFERAQVLLQLDLGSLIGAYGRTAERASEELVKRGAYHLAAGDLHRPDDVERIIPKSKQLLGKLLDKRKCTDGLARLVLHNPRAIVNNAAPSTIDPV